MEKNKFMEDCFGEKSKKGNDLNSIRRACEMEWEKHKQNTASTFEINILNFNKIYD